MNITTKTLLEKSGLFSNDCPVFLKENNQLYKVIEDDITHWRNDGFTEDSSLVDNQTVCLTVYREPSSLARKTKGNTLTIGKLKEKIQEIHSIYNVNDSIFLVESVTGGSSDTIAETQINQTASNDVIIEVL